MFHTGCCRTLNASEMIGPAGASLPFADHSVIASCGHGAVVVSVVGVGQAARLGAAAVEGQQSRRPGILNGEDPDLAVVLQDSPGR